MDKYSVDPTHEVDDCGCINCFFDAINYRMNQIIEEEENDTKQT